MPGKPDTVRGRSANVYLTEFDFFEQPGATWRAILPSITNPLRGGEKKVRLKTTPNGKGSAMHRIWTKEDKLMRWSRRTVTIYQAVLMGLPVDIEQIKEALDDPEGWGQEFECEFLDGSNVLLPYDVIRRGRIQHQGNARWPARNGHLWIAMKNHTIIRSGEILPVIQTLDDKQFKNLPRLVLAYRIIGLGDLVEIWAKPIGCFLDRQTANWPLKTRLCGCSACSRRRHFLNMLVPDYRSFAKGWKGIFKRLKSARKAI